MDAQNVVALEDAVEAGHFGGKAAGLARAVRAGLPVPPGLAIGWELAARVEGKSPEAVERLRQQASGLRFPVAVRSSGLEEDSRGRSFAGQHLSQLGVGTLVSLVEAVGEVVRSASASTVYRQRMGVSASLRMGVVVQEMVRASVAGILFTCDPVTGRDERLVEAAWGLGEVVVQGQVIPDRFRMDRQGRLLERVAGEKPVEIQLGEDGGTRQVEVEPARRTGLCLTEAQCGELHRLASACEQAYGGKLDIEWALGERGLALLQCRPVTRAAPPRKSIF
ncbi:PEP/pyruvate-binding domain-containing protein [Hyalangium minutum]|nr:PEP/pyruvate-binding domain-containing protein [Hyalangium minutum]